MQNDDEIDDGEYEDDDDYTTVSSETDEETSIEEEEEEEYYEDEEDEYEHHHSHHPHHHGTINITIIDEDIENATNFTKKAFDTMFDINITFHDLEHVYNPHLLRIMDANPLISMVEQYKKVIDELLRSTNVLNEQSCVKDIAILAVYPFRMNEELVKSIDEIRSYIIFVIAKRFADVREMPIRIREMQRRMGYNLTDYKQVLTEDSFGKIPTKSFAEIAENDNKCCYVCQDEFVESSVIKCLPCNHMFHDDCIKQWLTKQSNKCPCCRYEMPDYVNIDEDEMANNVTTVFMNWLQTQTRI